MRGASGRSGPDRCAPGSRGGRRPRGSSSCAAAGGEVGGSEGDALHARARAQISSTLMTPWCVSRMACTSSGREPRLRLELGQQLVHVVDVPGALDLRDHDHVEPVADLGDERRAGRRGTRGCRGCSRASTAGSRRSRSRGRSSRAPRAPPPCCRSGSRPRGCRAARRFFAMSGSFAAIFALLGSKKWIMRAGRNGISRGGEGAPIAFGLKKSFALRMLHSWLTPRVLRRMFTARRA
jgi:hypothetical protein